MSMSRLPSCKIAVATSKAAGHLPRRRYLRLQGTALKARGRAGDPTEQYRLAADAGTDHAEPRPPDGGRRQTGARRAAGQQPAPRRHERGHRRRPVGPPRAPARPPAAARLAARRVGLQSASGSVPCTRTDWERHCSPRGGTASGCGDRRYHGNRRWRRDQRHGGTGGTSACRGLRIAAESCLTTTYTKLINNEVDILFMIDNSSSMSQMQQKLYAQIPTFMNVLQNAPTPPASTLLSSRRTWALRRLGRLDAARRSAIRASSRASRGTCTATTLTAGDTFISDADGMPNYTDATAAQVLQCIALLGEKGCGFEHQLASIDRASAPTISRTESRSARLERQLPAAEAFSASSS